MLALKTEQGVKAVRDIYFWQLFTNSVFMYQSLCLINQIYLNNLISIVIFFIWVYK